MPWRFIGLLMFGFLIQIRSHAEWKFAQMTLDGTMRQYKVYEPKNLHKKAKLVVLLHGLGANMNAFDATSWPQIADTANILLLAPEALPYQSIMGEINGVFNSGLKIPLTLLGQIAINGKVQDLVFIDALIDSVIKNYSVDTQRIFMTGFSNGAFMAHRYAIEKGSRLAAMASVSGTRALSLGDQMPKPLPMAHFHGTADSLVQWDGYISLSGLIGDHLAIGVDSLISFWKEVNGIIGDADSFLIGGENQLHLLHVIFGGKDSPNPVELYLIEKGRHKYYDYVQTGNSFDTGYLTWLFFLKHQKK